MQVMYLIVGQDSPLLGVDVDRDATVAAMRQAIARQHFPEADAKQLRLFLARRGRSGWLRGDSDEVEALRRGEMPAATLRDLLQQDIDLGQNVREAFADAPDSESVHVLAMPLDDPVVIHLLAKHTGAPSVSRARKEQWDVLNAKLDESLASSTTPVADKKRATVAFSSLARGALDDVYEKITDETYQQPVGEAKPGLIDHLCSTLNVVDAVLGHSSIGNETKRKHFIVQALAGATFLCFPGDADAGAGRIHIDCNEPLDDRYIKAHGVVDFVIKRVTCDGRWQRLCVVGMKQET